jgi:hypothetical protein
MARIKNPILFSSYFNVSAQVLADDGLIDPFLDVDVPLFIDPVLLESIRDHLVVALVGIRGDGPRPG